MAVNWNVTFSGITGGLIDPLLGLPGDFRDIVTKEMQAAGQQWSQYLNVRGSVTINVNIDVNPTADPLTTLPYDKQTTVPTGIIDSINNKQIVESYAAYKLRATKSRKIPLPAQPI